MQVFIKFAYVDILGLATHALVEYLRNICECLNSLQDSKRWMEIVSPIKIPSTLLDPLTWLPVKFIPQQAISAAQYKTIYFQSKDIFMGFGLRVYWILFSNSQPCIWIFCNYLPCASENFAIFVNECTSKFMRQVLHGVYVIFHFVPRFKALTVCLYNLLPFDCHVLHAPVRVCSFECSFSRALLMFSF